MNIPHNPPNAGHGPGHYSLGIEVPAGARMLFIAGQVPIAPDGTVAENMEGQAECVWNNIKAVLNAAGMGLEDLVKITVFLTGPEGRKAANEVRKRVFSGFTVPASTGVVITALADPTWLIEVEAIAAKS